MSEKRAEQARGAAESGNPESGFTLVELLIALVIMPLILGAIAAVVITGIKDQTGVSGRISDSSSAQITSAFYVRDVESAAFVTTKGTATTPVPCGFGTSAVSGLTFSLGLTWGSPTAGGVVVSYWVNNSNVTTAAGVVPGDLMRLYCTNGSATPSSTVSVAHDLSSASPVLASISPTSSGIAANNGWVTTVGISAITLGALENSSTYNFDLLAVPRTSVEGNGGTPVPPLLLLGSGAGVLDCSGANGQINVNGTAYIDSSAAGAVNIGNSTLTATAFYTNNSNPSQSVTSGPNGSYSPDPPQQGGSDPDPFLGLTPPTAPNAPIPTTSGSTTTYYPGTYQNAVSLSGNGTVVFNTGTYIFQNGISTSGTVTVQSQTVSDTVSGVLFYVSGGSIDLTGNGSLTLTPEIPAPYTTPFSAQSLVIWQAASDTNPIKVAGNGGVHTISGTIYAPKATVGGGGNGNYQTGAIVANKLACNGNGSIGVG